MSGRKRKSESRQSGVATRSKLLRRMVWVSSMVLLARVAHPAPVELLNSIRARPCDAGPARRALHASHTLDTVAQAVAGGVSLRSALERSGFEAEQATLIHYRGPRGRELEASLRSHYCLTVTDPRFDFAGSADGQAARSDELWMVLAARFTAPRDGQATAIDQEALLLTNQARSHGRRCGSQWFAAAPPVSSDAALTRAAIQHARSMAARDVLEHSGEEGSTPAQRVVRAGFPKTGWVGENIAGGPATASQAIAGWLASPEHCANLMSASFDRIGIAYAANPRARYRVYWVQELASSRRPN